MVHVPSAIAPVHAIGRTVPSGRLLRAACAAAIMLLALPCATTAADLASPRPAAPSPSAD